MPPIPAAPLLHALLSPLAPLLPLIAQAAPDVWRLVERGGQPAVIVALVFVVLHRERVLAERDKRIAELHDAIHTNDKAHADALHAAHVAHAAAITAAHTAHTAEMAKVTEDRLEEMTAFTERVGAVDRVTATLERSVASLDGVARTLEPSPSRKR